MEKFDKIMALDVIEDAHTALNAPENRGYAFGLCCGFFLCGLLSQDEWEDMLKRIRQKCRD